MSAAPCPALPANHAPDAAALAALRARAALVGMRLVLLRDGTFVVGRWGLIRTLPDVAAVEQFLRRVGAPA